MRIHFYFLLALFASVLTAVGTEKTDEDYPLGKIGGKYFAQEGNNTIRVSELTAGGPGELAGLLVNDYIFGAFGEEFDDAVYDTWGIWIGPTKGLGEAIEKAQRVDGSLPLMVMRAGVGTTIVTVQLDNDGGLGPVFPLGSTAYEAQYEIACAAIHESISNNGNSGVTGSSYPYRWAGIALIGHPDWNTSTGDKPYRLSIDIIRDSCLSALETAQYAPQEQYHSDGTSNPNFVNQFSGHENWKLNTSLMFLAEYLQKTKDEQYYDELQTYSEKIANRIQWWKQYGSTQIASGAHAGVHSDYNNNGFNICVVHSYSALAMAKNVTAADGSKVVDLSVRARDARHFGYATEAEKPAGALNVVPDGWDEAVDPSISEKMGWQWEQLKASMYADYGNVTYTQGVGENFSFEASARSSASIFAHMTQLEGADPSTEDQVYLDKMTDYLVRYQEHLQNSHTHTISGVAFNFMSMPYWKPQQRRYLLDQWKFYWQLAWQPQGASQEYFTGWIENDNDSNYLLGEIFTALPYSIARGGLELVPGWDTDDLIVDFHNTPFEWNEPEYRTMVATAGALNMNLSLSDSIGNTIDSASYTALWTVESSNAASVAIDDSSLLSAGIQFSQDGIYELKLSLQSGAESVTELIQVHVNLQIDPTGYELGKVVLDSHGDFNLSTVTAISGTPSRQQDFYCMDFPPQADTMGREIDFYIIPKETGSYQFYIASSDIAELHHDPDGSSIWQHIASSATEVDRYDWENAANSPSVAMTLTAGEAYHFKLFDKTGQKPGYLSLGWKTPSNSTISLIDSSVLALEETVEEVAAITLDISDLDRNVGSVGNLSFYTSGSGPKLHQWFRNGEAVGDPDTSNRLLFWPVNGGSQGEYYCECTIGNTVLTSNVITLNVLNNTGSIAGGIWIDVFKELEGSTVADLEAFYGFPWFTTSGYTTKSSFYYKTTSQNTNWLGHRASAWVVPAESGNYKFFVSADDNADLYLSPTEYDAHMVKIAATTGSTGERTWSSGKAGESEYIALVAGERYYIELRHKEKQGASYFAVAWQKEGDAEPVNGEGEIGSEFLEYRTGGYHSNGVVPAPILFDDALNVAEMTPALIDVTTNDAFVGEIEVLTVSSPANGYARISSDGKSIAYTHSGSGGAETLTYTARQSDGQTGDASLQISEMTPVTDGLVAYWPLDAIEVDNTISDESGNGFSLTIVGDPSVSADAVNGSSLLMRNDTMTIPTGVHALLSDEITISYWSKRDSAVNLAETTLFDATDSSGTRLLEVNAPRYNASVWFDLGNASGYDRIHSELTQADFDDDWSHWVFTKNSTTGEMVIYKNGLALVSSTAATKTFDTTFANFSFGSRVNGSRGYPGWVDDVRIHSRVLGAEEIATLYYKEGTSDLGRWVDSYLDESIQDDAQKGGVSGDASGNGVANGFYYAFGLGDPNSADVGELVVASKTLGLPITYWTAEGNYGMSFVMPKSAATMTLTPMVSTDLNTWVPYSDGSLASQLLEESAETIDLDYEMRHLEFQQQSTPQFFRFEVESN